MLLEPARWSAYTDEDWNKLAHLARQQNILCGFYNDNYRLAHDKTALLFRFPKINATQFDPRPMEEVDVYGLIKKADLPVPELIYVAPDRSFQVHKFIQGVLINDAYPSGQPLSDALVEQIVLFYQTMARLEINPTKVLAKDWPLRGQPFMFVKRLQEFVQVVYKKQRAIYKDMYQFLNLPEDPFPLFRKRAKDLYPRPWRLLHGDIHRGNMIMEEDGRLVIIDWELALYGDLLYCIASHLHRCRYEAYEKEKIALKIYQNMPSVFQKNYMTDLAFYLDFEALKSVLGDTIRFPALIREKKVSDNTMKELCAYYADNLVRISQFFGNKTMTAVEVLVWFSEYAKI